MPWRGPSYPGEVPTLGYHALDWIADNLIVPDGATAGEPLIFTGEQAQFVLNLYRVKPDFDGQIFKARKIDNARVVRRAVLSRPKGWGKSPLLAALCAWEALGDCLLDGWDEDGEPVGRTWHSVGFKALVQIIAVSDDQTANTWIPLLEMMRNGPVLKNYDIEPMETFINVPNGCIESATSSGNSREGFRPVFYAMDQTESWKQENRGVSLAGTLRRNLAKIGGLSVESPNGFIPGLGSVAEASYLAAQKQKEGKLKNRTGIYYDHREMPADTDIYDRESLRAGLAVAYGESADVNGGWVDLDRIVDDYWDPDTDPQDAARFFGNQITAAADSWLAQPEWNACRDLDKIVEDGDTITLGFDGSRKRQRGVTDATALVGCRVSDGHVFLLGIWEQPDGPEGEKWEVPVIEVLDCVKDAFERFNVIGFYADPARWEGHVSQWEATHGDKMKVKVTQNHPCEWWMTGGRQTLIVRALKAFHNAVVNKEMTHSGSYPLTRHMLNARRRVTNAGITIAKDFPTSPKKIDAAIAATLAWRARIDSISAGATTETKKSRKLYRW